MKRSLDLTAAPIARSRQAISSESTNVFCHSRHPRGAGLDRTVPSGSALWREGEGFRLIHACWNEAAIANFRTRRPDGFLAPQDPEEVAAESTPFGRAVKLLVSGPEARLPDREAFHDFGGEERHEVRLARWRGNATTWRKAAPSVPRPEDLPDQALPPEVQFEPYTADQPPVFVGHYKMAGTPIIDAPNAVCLDYPHALCIYLWQGEAGLKADHLLRVPKFTDAI